MPPSLNPTTAPSDALPGDPACFEVLDAVGAPTLMHRGGLVLYANPAMERLTGFSRAELMAMPFYDIGHPKVRNSLRLRGEARLRGEPVPESYEFIVQTKAGAARWVELTGRRSLLGGAPAVVATLYDLTARKQAETDHRLLRQLLGQIIDGDPVPTFVIDAQHQTMFWNKACAVVTGVPADQVVGTNRQWAPFYPAERPVMADLIVSGALEENFATHYQGKFHRSALIDGAFEAEDFFPNFGDGGRWLFFTAAPLRDQRGNIIGAVETLQDVTERRMAEQALRDAQTGLEVLVQKRTQQLVERNAELTALNSALTDAKQQLVQSEKLASIGQLAAGVAHEINNPIGYVHSNIGALEGYLNDLFRMLDVYQSAEPALADPAQAARVKAARQEVDLDFLREDTPMLMRESKEGITRVKKIVQDLKDFSHVDSSPTFQFADLHKGIDSTLNVVANEIKYKADVVKEYGDLPEIECLPSQINQVIMNLCVNAAHAMPEGLRGRITIRTGRSGDEGWIEVADNGCGIPPEILNKIFDPFFTTKPVGKGTGLGLSLSHGIIRKHDGRLEVVSEVGQGTTFRITLPIRHVASADTQEAS